MQFCSLFFSNVCFAIIPNSHKKLQISINSHMPFTQMTQFTFCPISFLLCLTKYVSILYIIYALYMYLQKQFIFLNHLRISQRHSVPYPEYFQHIFSVFSKIRIFSYITQNSYQTGNSPQIYYYLIHSLYSNFLYCYSTDHNSCPPLVQDVIQNDMMHLVIIQCFIVLFKSLYSVTNDMDSISF